MKRLSYALAGGLLSAGAPLGLLGVRLARNPRRRFSLRRIGRELAADAAGYTYVSVSTSLAFTLFGFLLGRQADQLIELSQTDSLTALLNARGFAQRLSDEIARSRRYREPLALVLADLDGLKRINDRRGHQAGDAALRRVASALRAGLRTTDVGARWGGDEFAILAPNTPEPAAWALATRICALIAEPDDSWRLTASFGVATYDPSTDCERFDAAFLRQRADRALYAAKRRGGNTVAISRAVDERASFPLTH